MIRDIFHEDVLAELLVEDSRVDLEGARDALREAHNLSLEVADMLSRAADSLPVGEQRDAVRNLQGQQVSVLFAIGDTLRS